MDAEVWASFSVKTGFTSRRSTGLDVLSVQMASQIPITIRAQPAAASSAALRGKKRPGSPAVSAAPQAPGSGSKKKKAPLIVTPTAPTQVQHTQPSMKQPRKDLTLNMFMLSSRTRRIHHEGRSQKAQEVNSSKLRVRVTFYIVAWFGNLHVCNKNNRPVNMARNRQKFSFWLASTIHTFENTKYIFKNKAQQYTRFTLNTFNTHLNQIPEKAHTNKKSVYLTFQYLVDVLWESCKAYGHFS